MQRRLPLVIAAIFAALFTTVVQAQTTGTLTGKVTDSEGNPIIGATIRIVGTTQGGVSKSPGGEFTIAGIRAGDYTVKVTSIGYQPKEQNVRISVNQVTTVGFTLLISAVQGQEVKVTAGRILNPERVGSSTTITTEDLDRSARTSIIGGGSGYGGGIASVGTVSMSKGTASAPSNGVSFRGGRATETNVQVDGVKITDPYAGGFANSSPQVVPSGFSGEYNETLSGAATSVTASKAEARKDNTSVVQLQNGLAAGQPLQNSANTTPQETTSAEQYDAIYENPFITANINRTSTFSIDVDRASYSNMRRFVNAGQRPPRDAVRIEEFINYFSYDYPEPTEEHPFSIFTEVSDCPWDRTHRLVMVGIQGKHVDTKKLPPANLVFLIDVSGSMSSTDKLPLLKQGLGLLVDQLREEDNVAIVVYAGAAGLVLPPTSGAKKKEIREAIDRLSSGGSTAGGAGIKLAYETAKQHFKKDGNNRVILATDGDFNVGVSNDDELVKLIEQKREEGVFLTVLGFGTGNYKDSKMEKLADNGNGNYAYIDNLAEAKKTLVEEMGSTLLTIAKDVKIQIEFNPESVASYRLVGYENRMLRKEDFENDKKDAGELGAGHTVTALYEVVPAGAEAGTRAGGDTLDIPWMKERGELMEVRLRYKPPTESVSQLIERQVEDRNVRLETASENLRWAATVAQFGLLLRNSQHKGSASFEDVLRLANAAKGNDATGYRAEFISLVEKCKGLPMASR